MNRRQAAQLLGIVETASAIEANQAFFGKLKELDDRIQTAPSEALRQKYQDMRVELLGALQTLTRGEKQDVAAGGDVADLPGATPTVAAVAAVKEPVSDLSTSSQQPLKPPEPNRSPVWLGLGAGFVVLVALLGWAGVLGTAWESIRPMSADERLTAFTEAKSLEAEIKGYQQRLEDARRGTEAATRDAANEVRRFEGEVRGARSAADRSVAEDRLRSAAAVQAQAERIEQLKEAHVFNGSTLIELQGDLAAGSNLIDRRGDENTQAIVLLQPVRAGFIALVTRVGTLAERAQVQGETEEVFAAWESWSAGKAVADEADRIKPLRIELSALSSTSLDEEAIAGYKQLLADVEEVQNEARSRLQNEADIAAHAEAQRVETARSAEAARVAEEKRRAEEARRQRIAALPGIATPEMVQIPGRSYRMGRYEVTFAQYDAFVEATGREQPSDSGWGRGTRPVINVSWNDATAFAAWLSEQTGKRFRLPTEAEWEHATRAGSTTEYWWGNEIGSNRANCDGCGSQWDKEKTAPVGSFAANPFGLFDVHGNVWEWTSSCYDGNCGVRVLRGGSWALQSGVAGFGEPLQEWRGGSELPQRLSFSPGHPLTLFTLLFYPFPSSGSALPATNG